jgi:sugar phosphate isomerase/epimerase
VTRRQLLGGMAASLTVSDVIAPKMFAAFDRPLGVQVYTVRSLLPTKGEETLRAIAAIGYKEVEISLDDAKKFAAVLKATGLRATGAHIDADQSRPQALDEFIGKAKDLGIPAIGVAYVTPAQRKDPAEFWPRFVDGLNRTGEQCAKAGLTFYYHHHNFEFDPKFRAIDVLHEKLGKDVKLEIDCFWASVGGADPATMIDKWSGRIFALHLKDKAKGTPNSYDTNFLKPAEFREVGAGMIDWSVVLKHAIRAGVQHFYVEQDYTPGDPIESLKKSYDYLRKVS